MNAFRMVSLDKILNLKAYDGIKSIRLKQISEDMQKLSFSSSHLDQSVGTVSLNLPTPLAKQCFENFIQALLWDNEEDEDNQIKKQEIWRLKGFVMLTESREGTSQVLPTMIQGVNETYELTVLKANEVSHENDAPVSSRLVLIGRNLSVEKIHSKLNSVLNKI